MGNIGERITNLRKAKNWSQKDLAQVANKPMQKAPQMVFF